VTANDVDAALAASIDQVGARLAVIAEDQWFERKSIRIHARDLGRPLAALANAEGGVIVIGIAAGQVEGAAQPHHQAQRLPPSPHGFHRPAGAGPVHPAAVPNQDGEADSLLGACA